MRSQGIGSGTVQAPLASLRWFGLGFVLVLGVAAVALGLALWMTTGDEAAEATIAAEDRSRALQLQRFGEWQSYEAPMGTQSEAWQRYRAGERAPQLQAQTAAPDGWAAYRIGERAPLSAAVPPPGWATYRAGERTPR